jgi:hypothetical protein
MFKICDYFICSTSWQSNLEKSFVYEANLKNKKVISILDHWANYKERFFYKDKLCLPSEIWVCDSYALDIAKSLFKKTKIKLIPNPYIKKIKKKIYSLAKKKYTDAPHKILYVCEPIKEHAMLQHGNENHYGYDENTALKYFLDSINSTKIKFDSIQIRPHPSESEKKYKWALDEYKNLNLYISSRNELIKDIFSSEIVVGCESMAMVIGIIANKAVFTSIPPWGRKCILPHSSIKNFYEELT